MRLYSFLQKHWLATAIILIGIILTIIVLLKPPFAEKHQIIIKPTKIETLELKLNDASPIIYVFGSIESLYKPNISSSVSGNVLNIYVEEGDSVEKNDLLVKLDDSYFQTTLASLAAEQKKVKTQIDNLANKHTNNLKNLANREQLVQSLKNDIDRKRSLARKKAEPLINTEIAERLWIREKINLVELQFNIDEYPLKKKELEAELEMINQQIEKTKLDIKNTNIIAPYDGEITKLHVAIGEHINIGNQIITMYDKNSLEIKGQIPTRYYTKVISALDNKEKIIGFIEDNHKQYKVILKKIIDQIDDTHGGFDAFFTFAETIKNLPVSTTLRLTVLLPVIKNVFLIPNQAIHHGNTVYKVIDNQLLGVKVKEIGITIKDGVTYLLIASNRLKVGDKIMTTRIVAPVSGRKVISITK